jgi:hypothetical protein
MSTISNEFRYRVRRFDGLNSRIPFSQTAEIIGATLLSAAAIEQFSQGNVVSGLVELAGGAALAGASRSDVRVLKQDYAHENTRLR